MALEDFVVKGNPLNTYLTIYQNVLENTARLRALGSAVIAMCYAACGRADIYCALGVSLWDIMPASLLAEEAGGKVTQVDGKPIDYAQVQRQCILATNGIIHERALKLVREE